MKDNETCNNQHFMSMEQREKNRIEPMICALRGSTIRWAMRTCEEQGHFLSSYMTCILQTASISSVDNTIVSRGSRGERQTVCLQNLICTVIMCKFDLYFMLICPLSFCYSSTYSLWPVWKILTPFITFTLFMGVVFLATLIPVWIANYIDTCNIIPQLECTNSLPVRVSKIVKRKCIVCCLQFAFQMIELSLPRL